MTNEASIKMLTAMEAFEADVKHTFAQNGKVNIHCASIGEGPLVVMLHGFPDHWLGWWKIMRELSSNFKVVAVDLRGYNLSDKPEGISSYEVEHLTSDVRSVIEHFGERAATIIGHDWGGYIAWHMGMNQQDWVKNLVVLNMPHPWAISRELANNEHQRKASQYARVFKQPGAHLLLTLEKLNFWVNDSEYKSRHDAAMQKSSLDAMLNYYRANWPSEPYTMLTEPPPKIKARTLLIHGLRDIYALPAGLNDVWCWVNNHVTIETLPQNGHFVQHENPETVAQILDKWLT